MLRIEIGSGMLAHVESWKAFAGAKDTPAVLQGLQLVADGHTVTFSVTDKYRVLQRTVEAHCEYDYEVVVPGEPVSAVVPFAVLSQAVALGKKLPFGALVVISITNDGRVIVEHSGGTVQGDTVKGLYPVLARAFDRYDDTAKGDADYMMVNPLLLAGWAKLISPVTGKKYADGVQLTFGSVDDGKRVSGACGVTVADDSGLRGLIQPMTKLPQ